ncbi:uncharacterized protein [Rutidosis leptorrhynchoides]|uniref:uncharacterized protein isoform X2 n=1 Tax=Rutidosis leptorrhynchoides TaxID=125765 RepID=UPI003A9976B5
MHIRCSMKCLKENDQTGARPCVFASPGSKVAESYATIFNLTSFTSPKSFVRDSAQMEIETNYSRDGAIHKRIAAIDDDDSKKLTHNNIPTKENIQDKHTATTDADSSEEKSYHELLKVSFDEYKTVLSHKEQLLWLKLHFLINRPCSAHYYKEEKELIESGQYIDVSDPYILRYLSELDKARDELRKSIESIYVSAEEGARGDVEEHE